MHKKAIEVQCKKIEKQRKHFQLKIEILENKIKELEEKKGRLRQKQKGKKISSTLKSQIAKKKEQITQSLQTRRLRTATGISKIKGPEKICSNTMVAATRPKQNYKCP